MQFEITKDFINEVESLIADKKSKEISKIFEEIHPADIADVLDELSFDEAVFIIRLLDSETTSDILEELEDDTREKVLEALSSKEIAKEIDELETDAAADILGELPEERQEKVIAQLEDKEHAQDIVDLLRYDEDTAGGLMGKELVAVNENWSVLRCVKEMRKQAQEIDEVYIVYVIDDNEILKGRLSLKSLLTTATGALVKDIYIPEIHFVKAREHADEVAQIMQKYDLFVIPVVNELNHLIGNITIDDVVDYIREEAEKDYQMAAGLTDDVEADDTIYELIKGRLPWLVLGLFGGLFSVLIMSKFDAALTKNKELFFFAPLIAAMAGNVGVQSSAIIVQGLANKIIKGSMWQRLIKEVGLSLFNGLILALLVVFFSHSFGLSWVFSFTVGFSLIIVIIMAALVGTFIPIILDKKGIDPALATGPFITTSNDIFGIFIFFYIAKILLGF
jgi:magnesium transporter